MNVILKHFRQCQVILKITNQLASEHLSGGSDAASEASTAMDSTTQAHKRLRQRKGRPAGTDDQSDSNQSTESISTCVCALASFMQESQFAFPDTKEAKGKTKEGERC